MEQDKELIDALDPLFKLPQVKKYLYEVVYKVGSGKKLHPRRFLVTTVGIFLLKKQNFPSKMIIIGSISFCDLVSIYIAGKCGSFSSSNEKIQIKHDSINSIATLVYFLRQAQFPTDILPCSITFCEEDNKSKASHVIRAYDTVFIDRLLSCAFHYNLLVTSPMLRSIHLPSFKTFSITKSIIKSPLLPAILLSLTYEQDVIHLRFVDLALAPILLQLGPLFQYNRFLQTISFERVDFTDSAPIFVQAFAKVHAFRAMNWIFEQIDYNKSFTTFFESISAIGKPVLSLEFRQCNYTIEGFREIIQTIFFNEIFHSLEGFAVHDFPEAEDLPYIVLEIPTCNWVMQNKCLHKISLSGCEIDGSDFLVKLLSFDVGLQQINLSGNNFVTPFRESVKFIVQEIQLLELRNCSFSSFFFSSCVPFISTVAIMELDLSSIKNNNSYEFTSILMHLAELSFPWLETFAFNNNRMNPDQTKIFTRFIEKQASLTSLSINCSIDIEESPFGLNCFIQCLKTKRLKNLSIKSDTTRSFTFGPLLISLFKSLDDILTLDVTNQKIPVQGLNELKPYMQKNLIELHFYGSKFLNFDELADFCESLLETKLQFASFPTNDFIRLLQNESQEKEKRFEMIKTQYLKKYKRYISQKSNILGRTSSTQDVKKTRSLNKIMPEFPSKNLNNCPKQDFKSAVQRSQDVVDLLKECMNDENDTFVEPILSIMANIEEKYSMDNLLNKLKSQYNNNTPSATF